VLRGIFVAEFKPDPQIVPFPKFACNLLSDVIEKEEIKSFVNISEYG
jgi:hypothetical protein